MYKVGFVTKLFFIDANAGINNNEMIFSIASCGDYAAEDYPDHTYLSSYRFVPHQDATMQRKIMENHKKHV